MSESKPDLLRVLRSILLPVDKDIIADCASYIKSDMGQIEWLKLSHRMESVAILIFALGVILFSTFFVIRDIQRFEWVTQIGFQYIISIVLFIIYVLALTVIRILQHINEGESIFADSETNDTYFVIFRIGMSVVFLIIPFYIVWNLDFSLINILLMFMLSLLFVGSLIAGISSLVSTYALIQSEMME